MKIVILSYDDGVVYVRDYDPKLEDSEFWFNSKDNEKLELRQSNCTWMVVKDFKFNME
jgi:hypothetical protein